MNHYDVLGVDRTASYGDIRRAYYDAARRHHPDLHQGDGSAMAAINAAWAVLGDPLRRQTYDRELPAVAHAPPEPEPEESDEFVDDRPAWAMEPDVSTHRPGLAAQAVVMVPAALLAVAVAVFALSAMMGSAGLMLLAILLVPIAGVGFVAAPLLMIRNRRPREARGRGRGSR